MSVGYGVAAAQYWQRGWLGVLPLPPGRKTPPPYGYTGRSGRWPDWDKVHQWEQEHDTGNVAIRVPNTVVGIDVDDYDNKKGAACLDHATKLWGELPPTVRSTSRLAGTSGIRMFRIPPGVELATVITFPDLGLDGIEVVQYFHRYTVAWPSVHPTTKRVYRWLDSDGNLSPIPYLGSLPDLPETWIAGLRRTPGQTTSITADVEAVMSSMPEGPMSLRVRDRLNTAVTRLRNEEE